MKTAVMALGSEYASGSEQHASYSLALLWKMKVPPELILVVDVDSEAKR